MFITAREASTVWVRLRAAAALALCALAVTAAVRSDVPELKDGTVLEGMYKGGSQTSMRFQVGGDLQVVPIDKILALTITGRSVDGAAAAMTSSTQVAAAGLPAGTRLLVKTTQGIDTRSNKAGSRFTARLEGTLIAGGKELVPAGAKVYGRVVTAKRGGIGSRKPVLELELTEISIDGVLHPIATSVMSGTGESGGAGGKVLKGAAIGGLYDGSSGAKDGAKVGLGIAILGGGKHAGVASGTLLELFLTDSLNL